VLISNIKTQHVTLGVTVIGKRFERKGHLGINYSYIEIYMGHYIVNSHYLPNSMGNFSETWAYGPWPLSFLIPGVDHMYGILMNNVCCHIRPTYE
jgi:hypothetical protein